MSGMLKEVLYWPKRTRIKDDGSEQWYKSHMDEDGNEIIVCEIGARNNAPTIIEPTPMGTVSASSSCNWATCGNESEIAYLNDSVVCSEVILEPDIRELELVNGLCHYSFRQVNIPYENNFSMSFGGTGLLKLILSAGMGNMGDRPFIPGLFSLECDNEYSTTVAGRSVMWEITAQLPAIITGVIKCDLYPEDDGSFYFNHEISPAVFYQEPLEAPSQVKGIDINPIHQIREIITNDNAMNKTESMINDENFKFAARRIWHEGLGVSGAFTEKSCKEAIDELLYHIEAGIRVNRQTGLYEIVLFRDDLLDLDNAQVFNESNIKSFNIEVANIDDMINSVNVNYYDRDNIKDSSFSLDEIGSILSSQSNAETIDFPYFMNRRNAELVGNWKLKQLSTPTRKGSFTTGKYDARKINRYDVMKLTWPNQNMFEVPVRIMKIGLGDGIDNTVTLDWVEVIPFSSINYPSINVDQSTSVALSPQPNQSIAFEMPYFEAVQRFGQSQVDTELSNNPDFGHLMVATKKPQNNSINALLFTDNGTGYKQASIVDYCPTAVLDQDISYLDTSFTVKDVSAISQAEIGTLILCDEELMVYQSYDDVTKILTVKRAALDTVPKPHLQGAVFYFYDSFSAFDSEQYVLGEVINAKVLTTTPSGIQRLGDATALSVEMNARAIRPYPPANVKINGEYYPAEIDTDLILTWVDRNRLQQTGGEILSWFDGGVTIESGTSTMLTIKELDVDELLIATHNIDATGTNTYTLAISSMQAETRSIEVTAKTVRDGYECLHPFEHIFELSQVFSAPYNLTVEFKND
ncbi:phage tail protein [Acinetobacter septicus]|nr:phage tail protein [Acinetobacter septicus]QXZ24729.1 phage tail protein [Acinetobacter septicus]